MVPLSVLDLSLVTDGAPGAAGRALARTRDLAQHVEDLGFRRFWVAEHFVGMVMALALARTAADHGASLLNYFRVTGLLKEASGAVSGVAAVDEETGESREIRARVVVNATGQLSDGSVPVHVILAEPLVNPAVEVNGA